MCVSRSRLGEHASSGGEEKRDRRLSARRPWRARRRIITGGGKNNGGGGGNVFGRTGVCARARARVCVCTKTLYVFPLSRLFDLFHSMSIKLSLTLSLSLLVHAHTLSPSLSHSVSLYARPCFSLADRRTYTERADQSRLTSAPVRVYLPDGRPSMFV